MITASELAGYFAAHAIWSLSESDTFSPIFAYTTEHGEKKMERLLAPDAAAAVEAGRTKLEADEASANDGVLLFDGRISTDAGKLDAVIIEMRSYAFPWAKATIAVPYTPRNKGRFLVHKPKLLCWDRCEDFDLETTFAVFFEGVAAHEQGAAIWNEHLDEST